MRVLVTGGTGYLGRAVVHALSARGHEPRVFARRATAAGLSGAAVDGDIRDVAALARALAGCDAVVHMAALVSIWRRRRVDFDDVNVGGLINVIASAARAGVKRIIYTSSFLALPPAGQDRPLVANDYQRTKAAADAAAEAAVASGAPLVRLYPGVLYGPGEATEGNLVGRLVRDHLAGRLPGVIGAGHIWSFAYLDDVATAHVAAVERGQIGGRYAVGGENAPQRRLFEVLRDLTGRALPREWPSWLAYAAGAVEEGRVRLTGGLPLVTRGAVEIFQHDWPLDSGAAERDLGYGMTPLARGVAQTLATL